MRRGLVLSFLLTGLFAEKMPLPEKALAARTVALVNAAGGETGVMDGIYSNLKKWGRWQIVDRDQHPDLLLLFSGSDRILGSMTTATATGNATYAAGSASTVPLMSMKRYLIVVDPATNAQLFTAECERRLGAGYTGGVLVNELKKRVPKGR
jgi:hypothetical protein